MLKCPSTDIQTKRHTSKYDEPGTFFVEARVKRSLQKQILCSLCVANHYIWQCKKYLQKSVHERWNFDKQFRLCYWCLAEGHLGKLCPKSRQCGLNGCQKLHHWLLHKTDNLSPRKGDLSQTETKFAANAEPKECPLDPATLIGDAFTFGMEGKGKIKQTQTAMTYATYNFETTRNKSNYKKKSKYLDSSKSKNRYMSGIARSLRRTLRLGIPRSLRRYLNIGIAQSLRRYISLWIVRSLRRDLSLVKMRSLRRFLSSGRGLNMRRYSVLERGPTLS